MQLTEIIKRVQRIFGDEDEVQIKVSDVISWVSDGQMEVARQTECLTKDVWFDYDPNAFTGFQLPADFILEKRVAWYPSGANGESQALNKTTLEMLDQFLSNPQAKEDPGMYYLWAGKILPHPIPSSTQIMEKAFRLWFVCAPEPLTQMNDQLQIPLTMHEDLVRYALMRARELNEDVEQADRMGADLTNRLVQSRSEAFNPFKDQYPVIRDYYGDMW